VPGLERGRYKHNLSGELFKASTDGADSADRLALGYKLDRSFDERLYAWGSLRRDKDRFANIDARTTLGAGLGYKALSGPVHELNLEAGGGRSQIR